MVLREKTAAHKSICSQVLAVFGGTRDDVFEAFLSAFRYVGGNAQAVQVGFSHLNQHHHAHRIVGAALNTVESVFSEGDGTFLIDLAHEAGGIGGSHAGD